MIVHCPSCASRYEMAKSFGGEALAITCRRCGHRWKELAATDLVEIAPRASTRLISPDDETPDRDVMRLIEASQSAHQAFLQKRRKRLKRLSGWASLGLLVVAPFATAAFVPETIVGLAPLTFKAYAKLGMDVNVYGLDIRHVAQENKIINGAHVLMVKGEISNATSSVRKIPWMRFALLGADDKELYQWTLDTAARPLRPGETTSFVTRVAAPPELSRTLQIRFAHEDEIGSKTP